MTKMEQKCYTRGYRKPVGKPTGVWHITPGGERQEWREVPADFTGCVRSGRTVEEVEEAE